MLEYKYVIFWRDETTEEYTCKGIYDLRMMDLKDWGYIEGEDFTTWREMVI